MTVKHRKKTPSRRPSRWPGGRSSRPQISAPEITTHFGPAGRETLAAITAELESDAPGAPIIEVGQGRMGRETMAAIAADFLGDRSELSEHPSAAPRSTLGYDSEPLPPPRARLRTLDYSEPRDAPRTPPPVGRQTLEAIDSELTRWARSPTEGKQPPAPQPTAAIDGFEVHEMITFVVRGDVTRLASAAARRDFVRDYLLRRLPARSMDGVDRIDVTPWTVRGTVVVRVWCRVG